MTKRGGGVFAGPSKTGGWQVKQGGNGRASAKTETQTQAISIGRELAKKHATELVVQGRDGRIREKNSYGNDPNPPKDRR